MRFGNWEKWISAITKLGAVGSILFFALELQQNNKQLEAQARYTQFEIQSYDANRVVFNNTDLAAILLKDRNQKPLSELDSFILRRYYTQSIRNWEFEFMEKQRGLLDSNLSTARWAQSLMRNPSRLDVWNTTSAIWQDPFRLALNTAIENERLN